MKPYFYDETDVVPVTLLVGLCVAWDAKQLWLWLWPDLHCQNPQVASGMWNKHLGGHRRRRSKNCPGLKASSVGRKKLRFRTVVFKTNVGNFLIQICKCQLYIFSLYVFIKDSFFKRLNTRILFLKMSKRDYVFVCNGDCVCMLHCSLIIFWTFFFIVYLLVSPGLLHLVLFRSTWSVSLYSCSLTVHDSGPSHGWCHMFAHCRAQITLPTSRVFNSVEQSACMYICGPYTQTQDEVAQGTAHRLKYSLYFFSGGALAV